MLAGHVHPCAVLAGAAGQRKRLPCFWFGPDVGVLPAFGEFTGQAEVRAKEGDRVRVIGNMRFSVSVPPRPASDELRARRPFSFALVSGNAAGPVLAHSMELWGPVTLLRQRAA